ncbi:NAD(P)/FAD-dependent oxidoreductase [Mycobacterium sp.]|uniref:NAD(P)/FAD-dependent oxidoreductase n=1 Tax=Mycobacterium sp. TaxID=1785 RepID=UPI003D12FD72
MKYLGVVIVGASLAGLRTAEALRARSYCEPITLVGAEPGLPYDRPPLSKDYLSSDHSGEVPLLRNDAALAELDLEIRAETRAIRLDGDRRRVCLSNGDEMPYDDAVIATGADARRLPLSEGVDGFRTLRTLADAELLRADFDRRPKVVIVGGGFIGAEVAASARARDLDVDLVELLPAPMSGALGPTVAALLADLHTDHGVRLHCGVTVARVFGAPRVEKVELSNGTVLDADVVVMGLGVVPATAWLRDSGLDVHNGVKCDDQLQAIGRTGVYAVGDVARWTHPIFGESIRVEHWTNANEHADVVASVIMGEPRVAGAVPYVWSDQYHRKIQIVGRPAAGDDITLMDDPADGRHVAVYERRGKVAGVLTVDAPRTMLRGRRAIEAGTSAAELVASL